MGEGQEVCRVAGEWEPWENQLGPVGTAFLPWELPEEEEGGEGSLWVCRGREQHGALREAAVSMGEKGELFPEPSWSRRLSPVGSSAPLPS